MVSSDFRMHYGRRIVTCAISRYDPMSALIIFGISGFGFMSCNANSLTFTADVVPKNSTASVWGIASVGAGLGGAFFQALSGKTVKSLSESMCYTTAYDYLFVGYGLIAIVGVLIVLFVMGRRTTGGTLSGGIS